MSCNYFVPQKFALVLSRTLLVACATKDISQSLEGGLPFLPRAQPRGLGPSF